MLLLHLADAVVQQSAVVVRNYLAERAAAGAGLDVATGTHIAPDKAPAHQMRQETQPTHITGRHY